MSPEEYVQRLTEISNKKYGLLQDMMSLSQAQAENIKEDGIEELGRLNSQKQEIIGAIDRLDEQFSIYFLRLKQELKVKSLDELKSPDIKGIGELKAVVGKIMDIIREISELEEKNRKNAGKLLDHLGNEIKKLNQAKKVNTAYNPGALAQPPAYFIDKKK